METDETITDMFPNSLTSCDLNHYEKLYPKDDIVKKTLNKLQELVVIDIKFLIDSSFSMGKADTTLFI